VILFGLTERLLGLELERGGLELGVTVGVWGQEWVIKDRASVRVQRYGYWGWVTFRAVLFSSSLGRDSRKNGLGFIAGLWSR